MAKVKIITNMSGGFGENCLLWVSTPASKVFPKQFCKASGKNRNTIGV